MVSARQINQTATHALEQVCFTPHLVGLQKYNIKSKYWHQIVVWGVIGPARIFGAGAMLSPLQWYWLLGAAMPVITYFAAKRWPRSSIRYLHWPVIFSGNGQIPPATVYIYLCCKSRLHIFTRSIFIYKFAGGAIGMFFNGFLKRKFRGWWGKYVSSAPKCFWKTSSNVCVELHHFSRFGHGIVYLHNPHLLCPHSATEGEPTSMVHESSSRRVRLLFSLK